MRHLSRPGGVAVLAALLCLAAGPPEVGPETPIPLAVHAGRCSVVLPAANPSDKFLLIVGSLSRTLRSQRVRVRAEATEDAVSLPLANDDPGPAWRRRINDLADRLDRARRNRSSFAEYPPAPNPPRYRDFQLFCGSSDFDSGRSFAPIRGELRGVGRHCLVYIDTAVADAAALQPAVDEVIRVFENAIYPTARAEQGHCLDVDRDGRFAVLFSGRLSRMAGGKGTVSGFVLGSDFYRDAVSTPGNRCDMLYLSADLRPGPYLRTVVAHEYTHAVVFSEHVFGNYLPDGTRGDEESWINEGLAHLAEQRHGFSWSNLDYRVSAFLAAPERYPLVVPDYYGAGLWRDPGCRGATYLFLHCCACDDAGLSEKLVRSNLSGVANLEAATRESFAALFRRWTVAVGRGNLQGGHDLFRPLGEYLLCGVHSEELSLSGGDRETEIAGTAAEYLLLHSPVGKNSRITIAADADADLQVTLLPLPPALPRLSLRAEPVRPGAVRLVVTAHDADVTLVRAGRERFASAGRPEETGDRPQIPPEDVIRAWFGEPKLNPEETRVGNVIELPPGDEGNWLFKVSARDAAGRMVGASVRLK